MRQLLICETIGSNVDVMNQVNLRLPNGNMITFGSEAIPNVRGELSLVLNRTAENGGPIAVPVYAKDFSWSKKEWNAGTNKKISINIPAVSNPDTDKHYTVILVVKGKQFNERNKYSVTYTQKKGTSANLTAICKDIADKFTKFNLPINVFADATEVMITSTQNDFDFELLGADDAFGATVIVGNAYIPAQNTPDEFQELISKAAADKGFNYTYKAASEYLYPALNGVPAKESRRYDLYTLRFAEPRMVKTRDEVVHQIVQIAVFGTGNITSFEDWLKHMSSPTTTDGLMNPDEKDAGDSNTVLSE